MRTIEIDEQGRSCIISVNDGEGEVGGFGCGLEEGDCVELEDGSVWSVAKVHGRIQTGTSGRSNYVYADLELVRA